MESHVDIAVRNSEEAKSSEGGLLVIIVTAPRRLWER
jgi:hypothetical protein